MNIAIYVSVGFNYKEGGIQTMSLLVCDIFKKLGHRVYFISRAKELSPDFTINAEEEVYLPDPENVCSGRNAEFFTQYVRHHRIDMILCQFYPFFEDFATLPYLVKKATGVKVLYELHQTPNYRSLEIQDLSRPVMPSELTFVKEYKRITRLLRKSAKQKRRNQKMGDVLRRVHDMSDGVILLSERFVDIFQRMTRIQDNNKLHVIHNPSIYTPDQIVKTEKKNVLLYVGRLAITKRPDRILLIWAKIQHDFPDWTLKLVGEGICRTDLEWLIKKLDLQRCSLEGQKDPLPYYREAKIFLLTSAFEGFPMVLLEAMQNGVVPVVFNSFAAVHDLIDADAQTGVLVDAFDMDQFAEKLSALMRDAERLERMSEAVKVKVGQFSSEHIAEEWQQLLQQL